MSKDQQPGQDDRQAGRADEAARQDDLALRFSELARALRRQHDPHGTLEEIIGSAVALIPGAEEGSISVVLGRRQVRQEAPSGPLAARVDQLQGETGQGPCLDAAYEHETVRVPDMATEQRWPDFSQRALEAGAASMLCFQLYVDGDDLGALNLYARRANAFDDESEHVGLLFASHAAIAYSAAQEQAGLTRSIATRQLIGQAQGILMERYKVTADQAFALLVRASQHENVKLREIADRLTRSGVLPPSAVPHGRNPPAGVSGSAAGTRSA